jgi:hypothetical protein
MISSFVDGVLLKRRRCGRGIQRRELLSISRGVGDGVSGKGRIRCWSEKQKVFLVFQCLLSTQGPVAVATCTSDVVNGNCRYPSLSQEHLK